MVFVRSRWTLVNSVTGSSLGFSHRRAHESEKEVLLDMTAHACHPSSQEPKAGRLRELPGFRSRILPLAIEGRWLPLTFNRKKESKAGKEEEENKQKKN